VVKDLADRSLDFWTWRASNDPAAQAAWREAQERAQQIVNTLDPRSQQLWQRLAADTPVPLIAKEWGVSPETVWRRRRALLTQLCARFNQGLDA
jgi:FixJ family two-component response regulator